MLKPTVWKGLLGVSAVAALFGAFAVHAQNTQSSTDNPRGATTSGSSTSASGMSGSGAALNKADQKILMDIAQANMAEIDAAKLAQSKSQNEQVKNFAQQMIEDHTRALNDVQQLAQTKGVTLPTDVDSKHKSMESKLSNMSGNAFDHAYMNQAGVTDHKKVHAMLKMAEAKARDPDVKALAAKILPTVDQHLNSTQHLHGSKGETASGQSASPSEGSGTSNAKTTQ